MTRTKFLAANQEKVLKALGIDPRHFTNNTCMSLLEWFNERKAEQADRVWAFQTAQATWNDKEVWDCYGKRGKVKYIHLARFGRYPSLAKKDRQPADPPFEAYVEWEDGKHSSRRLATLKLAKPEPSSYPA